MSSSAQSLSVFIKELKESKDKTPTTQVINTFSVVMKNPLVKDSPFAKYTKLCQLLQGTRQEVEKLPFPAPYLTNWMPPVEQGLLNMNTTMSASNALGWLTKEVVSGVETCASAIQHYAPQECISEDDLKRFHDEANNLFQEVKDSVDIDNEVKEFLLKHLKDFISAIQDSWIMGVKPVKSAAANASTEVVFNPDITQKTKENRLGRRFLHLLIALNSITAPVSNTVVITQALGVDVILPQLTEEEVSESDVQEEPVIDADFEEIGKE